MPKNIISNLDNLNDLDLSDSDGHVDGFKLHANHNNISIELCFILFFFIYGILQSRGV